LKFCVGGFKLKYIGRIDLAAGLSCRTPSSHKDARSCRVLSNLQSAVVPTALPIWLHFGLPVMSHGTEQVREVPCPMSDGVTGYSDGLLRDFSRSHIPFRDITFKYTMVPFPLIL